MTQIEQLSARVAELEAEVSLWQNDRNELQQKDDEMIQTQAARIEELEAEIKRLAKLAYVGEHQFDDCTWKHRHGELRQQLAAAQSRVAELEVQCSDYRNDAADFHGQVNRLTKQSSDLVDLNNNLISHRDELIAQVSELEAENATLHEQVDLQIPALAFKQLQEQLLLAQAEIKRLRDELRKLIEFELLDSGANSSDELCYEYRQAVLAYNTPSDTSALDAYVAEKVKEAEAGLIKVIQAHTDQTVELIRQRDLAVEALIGIENFAVQPWAGMATEALLAIKESEAAPITPQ